NNSANPLLLLAAWIFAPIAAAIIQMAVSRSREYQADESGSYLSRDPEALANALRKLDGAVRAVPPPASVSPAEAHLFIMNPLAGPRGRLDEGDLRVEQPPPPSLVVVRGPPRPAEQEHREIGLHDELELGAAADLIRRRPGERQNRLDRVAIGVRSVGREREPQRQPPCAAGEVEREIGGVQRALR